MTKGQIEKNYNEVFGSCFTDERVVEIFDEGAGIVSVVSTSTARIVWKRWFYIENNELHFIKCECLL